ncbi:MAG TPA: hypothetical protein HA260_00775 [Thermoplasmata archaeon]|nr:hypothetical protein [Thermoplasmata archaeon]
MERKNKINKIIAVGLLIVFVLTSMTALVSSTNNFEESPIAKQVPSTPPQKPLWGWSGIDVHVQEIFGTLENPQYCPLSDVKIRIRLSVFEYGGFYLIPFFSGKTDEHGFYLTTPWYESFSFGSCLITISKKGYHPYNSKPYQTFTTPSGYWQDVYFTMTKDGSPFTKQCPKSYP